MLIRYTVTTGLGTYTCGSAGHEGVYWLIAKRAAELGIVAG
jgi:hypothetical protein